jgi:hypothetical protein
LPWLTPGSLLVLTLALYVRETLPGTLLRLEETH